jgi:hypothetical protein
MPGQFVASPVGVLDASGTGIIESQEHTNASHTGITHEFRVNVSKSDALFSAFSWYDINTEGLVDASSGVSEFDISLNQIDFAEALAAAMLAARGGKPASDFPLATNVSGKTAAQITVPPSNLGAGVKDVRTIMDREVRLEVEGMLNANGVLEYLEGDSLGEFSLAIDASGAATDMATKLADVANAKMALRNLFLQIPNRTDELDLSDIGGSRLPVMEGDVIAFIFTSDPKVYISQVTKTGNAMGDASGVINPLDTSGGANLDGGNAATLSGAFDPTHILTTSQRKIAFVIDVVA